MHRRLPDCITPTSSGTFKRALALVGEQVVDGSRGRGRVEEGAGVML